MSISKAEVLVHLFSVLLGLNSLISTNGLMVELPLMIPRLPESWSLSSYLTFIIQAANIGPIVYGMLNWLYPGTVTERPTCYIMLCVGSTAAMLMAFFWQSTVWILGAWRSLPLFVLTFCLGLVDSLSSMVCFPYMALLQPKYMTSYMIGEGLSGFLPTVLAIVQGSPQVDTSECVHNNGTSNYTVPALYEPVFSVEIFFFGLFTMLVTSWAGFYLLNNLSVCKTQHKIESDVNKDEISTENSSNRQTAILLFLQFYVPALFYGVLPSIQSFSCLPYGETPFYLSVILYSVASPTMAVLYAVFPVKKMKAVLVLVVLGTVFTAYLMTTAAMSPSPPLEQHVMGKVLLFGGWIGVAVAFGYTKVVVANLLCETSHRTLFWGGVLIQVGATLGALLMFLLVVVLELFEEEKHCT